MFIRKINAIWASNTVLERLDKYVEQELIPVYTCGKQRKLCYIQLLWEAI